MVATAEKCCVCELPPDEHGSIRLSGKIICWYCVLRIGLRMEQLRRKNEEPS